MTDWRPILAAETRAPYWRALQAFIADERSRYNVFPAEKDVFKALHLTPYHAVKVVILGQDPYHGDNQAMGLSFSVPPSMGLPPSLQNIYKELKADMQIERSSGDLTDWATQGVLLLNAVLTVRAHQATSHQGKGWEHFTDAILRALNNKPEHIVFILWGGFARRKKALIDTSRHTIIESPHPSPLSAHGGFFGSRPFSHTNQALLAHGQSIINW